MSRLRAFRTILATTGLTTLLSVLTAAIALAGESAGPIPK
jgi:uncharacterized membrane protein YdfJ with MMPL/SSD domain